ncbi:MAG: helix-turn-helix transcriptional regulator [Clostridium perfringens]|uniref:helix-turn-helix domain-containing protein n=1 Tax=Clostridium perfringens TaxID=1502 RepID=UPI001F56B6A1|nr:helix-turn-helix transcriptional regulator [Clostridium perfringens]MDH2340589.1 helix-turn-helix transcriptional regulator [Clostridium perfringens]MDK0888091.1 helix-turn-helix transcriptional regulator [Clostridium perfringens]MDU6691652.1 helix-turn-helix transcriptional regulator [Clostridium perfringens]UNM61933.1 helix-turn-helix domain-containing protein [Clostridium perfringens]
MIGLEYLLDINNMQSKQLAEMLGVGKATVSSWINQKRLISTKHYEKLKEIFKVPEEYFQKELTELDKLKLQQLKLETDTFEYTYTDTIWDDEKQQEIEVDCIGTNIPYEYMEMLDLDIREKELFNNLNNLIAKRTNNSEDEWDYIGRKADVLEIFETLVEIMDKEYIPDKRVKEVLDSIKIAKGNRLANSLFVKKLSVVIKEQMMRDKKTEEENIKVAKELLEIEDLL